MSDLVPQVGDVWKEADNTELLVHRIHDGYVVYSWIDENELCGDSSMFLDFMGGLKLIERDGKPYEYKREFEAQKYYPFIVEGELFVGCYNELTEAFMVGNHHYDTCTIKPEDIGEKIEFKGLS